MESDVVKQTIQELLERMGFGSDLTSVEIHNGVTSRFSIYIRDQGISSAQTFNGSHDEPGESAGHFSLNMLIGEHGNTLAALEHLLKIIVRKKYGSDSRFTIDINDYRMRGLEDLKQDVKAAAKEVRTYHKEVPLRPMSSFERRIVHLLLAEYPDITTESIGQEPDRKVIIKPLP